VALVTGANSGLGLAASKILARHGARLLLACRNQGKAEAAAGEIRAETAGAEIGIVPLDLASLASVAAAAKLVRDQEARLDLLINNAGLMAVDETRTEDGFEMQLGVNHLGHFALTAQLAPLLLSTPGSRIVTMSSLVHRMGWIRFDDLLFERTPYDRWGAYFQSKLANLLFTAELHRRLTESGALTIALAAHPGGTRTDLGFEGSGLTNTMWRLFLSNMLQPAWLGALPIVRAATDPDAVGGQFYGPRWMVSGFPHLETPSPAALREGDARRLWERSEELTGVVLELGNNP
jgi:NAD(P)-dependent dehydrogenase (short-subunit alcohol dehydrogenase family)